MTPVYLSRMEPTSRHTERYETTLPPPTCLRMRERQKWRPWRISGAVGFPKINASSKLEAGWADHSRRITNEQQAKVLGTKPREQTVLLHGFYVHFCDVIKRTCWPCTIRSYETEISTQRKPLARLYVCRSVRLREPWTTTAHRRFSIPIIKSIGVF